MKRHYLFVVSVLLLFTSGCADQVSHTRGVYMLLDTSGTYTKELVKAQNIINYTLSQLNPGDSFAVARIDTASFSEKDLVTKATFDPRPTTANQQKRQFRVNFNHFVKNINPSPYTDITGGILQGIEFLNEAGAGKKTILIFSDLKEELDKGYVRDIPLQLNGVEVVALNVTKLHSDNVDPREYMDRLDAWEKRVTAGGGTWRHINDLERLENIFID